MKLSLDETIDQLKALDRGLDYEQLAERLKLLPAELPLEHQAIVAFWRGKLAVLEGAFPEAIRELACSAELAPNNAAGQYLLGTALVRCEQWLDARQALTSALALNPSLAAARLELAAVQLALNDCAGALRQLEPLSDSAAGTLRGQRACAAVRTSDFRGAIQAADVALRQDSRLPETLLLEWLQFTGGLLMAGRLHDGRVWLQVLAGITPSVEAIANPVPRRVALIALVLLELIQPSNASLDAIVRELQLQRWLLPSASEHQLWDDWLESWVLLVSARLEEQPPSDLDRTALLLKGAIAALHSIKPPKRNLSGVFLRLEQLRRGIQPDAANEPEDLSLALQRHSYDWLRMATLLDQSLTLTSKALHRLRPVLEEQLERFSSSLLRFPQLLVQHPDPQLLKEAHQLRHRGLETLVRCRRRLAESSDAMPRHGRPFRHWLLLASDDLPQCFLYRVEQKRQQLMALGCSVRIVLREVLEHWDWTESLLWADAVIVCRLPATAPVLRAIDAAHLAGLPTWYDVDDLVVDPDNGVPPLETYGGTITPHQHRSLELDVPLFATAMRACRSAIVSTPTLAKRWRELEPTQTIEVLANLAPPELRAARRRPRRIGRRPRLVMASGTKAHKQIWIEELAPALAELLSRHSELQLDLLGHLQLPLVLQPHADHIRCHPFSDYATYLQRLGKADIGLVALEPGLYTDAKSAIRWMEFSYLGLASVLSPSRTYTEILEEGVHTRFARGREQWVTEVEQLLADPRGCRAMAARAKKRAMDLFGFQTAENFWRPLIKGDSPRPADVPRRRRLLVLNVFFAPNSVGGATRIAQDQVRSLCENLGETWDVTVLCTDPEPWMSLRQPKSSADDELEVWEIERPLPVEIHQWNGARVVRLTLPPRSWKQPYDRSVEAFCRRWLPQEGFDLIHSHCIQMLGIGPLIVAKDLGIPYAITLHDGWWLSPWQFLTTPSGRPVQVNDPLRHLIGIRIKDEQKAAALERDRSLREVLKGASARWAVSEAFAALHREAGVADVTVMENRWQPMAQHNRRRPRPANQPLRCCFIGGMALHKGFAVLQAAFLQVQPVEPGLKLTIVDSLLKPGEVSEVEWGTTLVRFVPPVAMDEMEAFYAEQDVLLAPSTWPESYGLVTREALSSGLWVVASDVGALADSIRDGENGHRVPAGDSAAFVQILEKLSAEHPNPQPLLSFKSDLPLLHQELNRKYQSIICSRNNDYWIRINA